MKLIMTCSSLCFSVAVLLAAQLHLETLAYAAEQEGDEAADETVSDESIEKEEEAEQGGAEPSSGEKEESDD
ncbi:MAG: hypothetical protein KDD69_10140 [Bdellovibrionales bacterium]|nr:hypothetical protein [Bdellovibrionales bacterium]